MWGHLIFVSHNDAIHCIVLYYSSLIYKGILTNFICICIVNLLAHFPSSMIILSNLVRLVSQLFLALSFGHIFNEICEVTKGAWPSGIAKEKYDTNLKVHCVI